MAGNRVLDAALFIKAARVVARRHLEIRSEEIGVWSRTSFGANYAHSRNRPEHEAGSTHLQYARDGDVLLKEHTSSSQGDADDQVPRPSFLDPSRSNALDHRGFEQDHHFSRLVQNASQDLTPRESISIHQEASMHSGPDGSFLPTRRAHGISKQNQSHQAIANQRRSLEEKNQDFLSLGLDLTGSTPPTRSRSKGDNARRRVKEGFSLQHEEVPDGIDTNVFRNPRVGQLLGNNKNTLKRESDNVSSLPKIDLQAQDLVRHDDIEELHSSSQTLKSGTMLYQNSQEAEPHHVPENTGEDNRSNLVSKTGSRDALAENGKSSNALQNFDTSEFDQPDFQMHESRVPSSRLGRLWQYGGLATSMAFGAVGESFRRFGGRGDSKESIMMNASNMERLVTKLSRMRGAALKLGQMISFQDLKMLPAPIHEVLQRVQDNADYMPSSQRDQVLASNLGSKWRSKFSSFEEIPLAAASIGQVHRATLASSNTVVAVKIQYPGVATSISSDLNNLSILLNASRLLPKGLYLDKTIANARTELAWECDYKREADCQARFRSLLSDERDVFQVPQIFEEASGPEVLTAELMSGIAVTKPSLQLSQQQRDWIGYHLMRLCLRELTEFRFMQTDPNWTNFLFNKRTGKLELLDFGAARDFPEEFVNAYVEILIAASARDRETVEDLSIQLGYLTGYESKTMKDAHIDSVMTLAEPFEEGNGNSEVFDFRDQTITDRVRSKIPTILKERLAPPPEETYSLHRKLSGAFLLLARLGSQVNCRQLFVEAIDRWKTPRRTKSTNVT